MCTQGAVKTEGSSPRLGEWPEGDHCPEFLKINRDLGYEKRKYDNSNELKKCSDKQQFQ